MCGRAHHQCGDWFGVITQVEWKKNNVLFLMKNQTETGISEKETKKEKRTREREKKENKNYLT